MSHIYNSDIFLRLHEILLAGQSATQLEQIHTYLQQTPHNQKRVKMRNIFCSAFSRETN